MSQILCPATLHVVGFAQSLAFQNNPTRVCREQQKDTRLYQNKSKTIFPDQQIGYNSLYELELSIMKEARRQSQLG